MRESWKRSVSHIWNAPGKKRKSYDSLNSANENV